MFKEIINKLVFGFKLSTLADDLKSRILLLSLPLIFPINKRIHLLKESKFTLRLKKFNREFKFIVRDITGLGALKEIFISDVYNFKLDIAPKVIFDLGGNIGTSVIYFKLLYPDSTVYVFEPDKNLIDRIRENTSEFSNIRIFNFAISGEDGPCNFFIYPGSNGRSSIYPRISGQTAIKVEAKKLDTILEDFHIGEIDLLKFDIEGAEYEVFKNFNQLDIVKNVIGEVHLDLISVSKKYFLDLFKSFNLIINDTSQDRLIIKGRNVKKNNLEVNK